MLRHCKVLHARDLMNISLSSLFPTKGARGFPGTPGLPGMKGHRVSIAISHAETTKYSQNSYLINGF